MTGNGLPVEIIELRRNGMRLRPEEWPDPMVGCLRMHYWDGRRNSSRRTLRQLTLYGSWGTTERPVGTLTDPQLIDVLGAAMLLQGQVLNTIDGRLHEHNQLWIVRPKTSNEPLPPFDVSPWAERLPETPRGSEDTSISERWLREHPGAKAPR